MNLILILDQTHHVLVIKDVDDEKTERFSLPTIKIQSICKEKCIHFKHFTDSTRFQGIDQIDIYIYPAFINPQFPILENGSIHYDWIPIGQIAENLALSPINGKLLREIYSEIVLEGYFPPNFCFQVWYFGLNESLANELVNLVVSGKKTATASYFDIYDIDKEKLPSIGEISVIVNWPGVPLVIIETTNVQIHPFKQVSAEHAAFEGEGDLSLAYWRTVHEEVFRQECQTYKLEFSEDAKVVCEQFRVIKKLNL